MYKITEARLKRLDKSLTQATFHSLRFRPHTNSAISLNSQAIDNVLQYQNNNDLKHNTQISSNNDYIHNTYSLGPNKSQCFYPERIETIVQDILNERLENQIYEPNKANELVCLVSDEIKAKIKPLLYRRYKVVVNMTITQNIGQSMMIVSRSIWDENTDNSCTVKFQNRHLYAVVMIFATYFE